MLVGASSSGKSTLLNMIHGTESPTSGSLDIEICNDDDDCGDPIAAVPMLLDDKPMYGNQQSVESIWSKAWEGPLNKVQKNKMYRKTSEDLKSAILNDIEYLYDLSLDQTVNYLSPSELYRCRLGEATIQSIRSSLILNVNRHDDEDDNNDNEKNLHCISSPILLLDEWMDRETSTVIQNVQPSLNRIIQERGAIVVTVTHKPNLYLTDNAVRKITLYRGKVLSIS